MTKLGLKDSSCQKEMPSRSILEGFKGREVIMQLESSVKSLSSCFLERVIPQTIAIDFQQLDSREQSGDMDWLQFFLSLVEVITLIWSIHYLLNHIWNSRIQDLLSGLSLAGLAYLATLWLDLPVLRALMSNAIAWAGLGLLIIFQPEIRLAVAKLGTRAQKYQEITEFDTFVEGLAQCIYRLAEKRIGALALVENNDSLDEFANKAVRIDALFTPELLESIFMPTTPLHDGAVIIRGTQIVSAATILPLAEDTSQVTKSMGTRHRAGLGISQRTDALVIVVSEETGRVSIAIDGIMTRGVKIDRFRSILRSVFAHPQIKRRGLTWFKR